MHSLTQTFAALADETRFALVERLLRHGELPAGDLVSQASISAPAESRHLKVLRDAGVIKRRAEGTKRYFSVRPEAMQAISGWTIDHRAFWEAGLDRLEAALASEGDKSDD